MHSSSANPLHSGYNLGSWVNLISWLGILHFGQHTARKCGAGFTLGPSKECLNAVHDFRQDSHFGLHTDF